MLQGLTLSRSEYYTTGLSLLRLWVHECERVFQDRLLSNAEIEIFREMMQTVGKQVGRGPPLVPAAQAGPV